MVSENDIDSFEEYYIQVCYDIHCLDLDPELINVNAIRKAFEDNIDVSMTVRIEAERIYTLLNPEIDYD